MARLQITPPTEEIGVDRMEAPHHAAARGTLHHEVLEGEAAVAFRSGDDLEIGVDCFADAGTSSESVRFGLVVSLELAEGVLIDVHDEVQQQLRVQARQPVRSRVNPGP